MDAGLIRASSMWDSSAIVTFLQATQVPLRLACITPSGKPLLCSLWYLYADGALWCATQKDAKMTRYLAANPACSFEVAPEAMPYRGVRGQGQVSLLDAAGPDVLGRLIDRYFGNRDSDFARWLLSRQDTETALQIRPDWITAWDFSARMG